MNCNCILRTIAKINDLNQDVLYENFISPIKSVRMRCCLCLDWKVRQSILIAFPADLLKTLFSQHQKCIF